MLLSSPALLGFAAYSGTGKTELLSQLIPLLIDQGMVMGVVKHAHHAFDIDQPGKDSYRLRKAGAQQMLISSDRRWALMHELGVEESEMELSDLVAKLDHRSLDLVLVEGFKQESFPKIELNRPMLGHPYLYLHDSDIIALATDAEAPSDLAMPHLDLNSPVAIAKFIGIYLRDLP